MAAHSFRSIWGLLANKEKVRFLAASVLWVWNLHTEAKPNACSALFSYYQNVPDEY